MGSFKVICFVFTSVLLNSVLSGSNKTCRVNETECITKAANKIYKAVILGIKDLTDTLDPYYAEKVNGDFDDIRYVQNNVTLTGAKNCVVEVLKVPTKEPLAYEYTIQCPKLLFDFHYEAEGKIENNEIDVIALAVETVEDMLVTFKGTAEKNVVEKDHKARLIHKEYQVESYLRGKYTIEHKKYFKGDQNIFKFIETYLNSNGKTIVNNVENPIFLLFLNVFMKSLNKYLAVFPIEELFAKDL